MESKEFLLVESSVLPEVFLRVLHAKDLLAGGQAKNVSKATKIANVSRSAFYKYKDSVFRVGQDHTTVTLSARLLDETGALQSLLGALSAARASVVTINQSPPENGAADVAVTIRSDEMSRELEALLAELRRQRTVVDIRVSEA